MHIKNPWIELMKKTNKGDNFFFFWLQWKTQKWTCCGIDKQDQNFGTQKCEEDRELEWVKHYQKLCVNSQIFLRALTVFLVSQISPCFLSRSLTVTLTMYVCVRFCSVTLTKSAWLYDVWEMRRRFRRAGRIFLFIQYRNYRLFE